MNLLLLLMAAGVVSDGFLNSGNGENNLEYLAFLVSRINDGLSIVPRWLKPEAELRSGVVMYESGRRVAMDTRLLG